MLDCGRVSSLFIDFLYNIVDVHSIIVYDCVEHVVVRRMLPQSMMMQYKL